MSVKVIVKAADQEMTVESVHPAARVNATTPPNVAVALHNQYVQNAVSLAMANAVSAGLPITGISVSADPPMLEIAATNPDGTF